MNSTLQEAQTSAEHERDSHDERHSSFAGARSLSASTVSIVIPCYNEERFIGEVLTNLLDQYEAERCEIIVVDGMSTDDTRQVIQEFIRRHPNINVRLVDNPKRDIPTALNLGIAAARGEVIVRMDAHSVPPANYVRRCVEVLQEGQAAVVGMPIRIEPGANTFTARAIALAVSHPFGIGDAKYRSAITASQYVDTVPFGAFSKQIWQEVGGFNEDLLTNEDYDFYYRVRQAGGRILLDASEHSIYFSRPTLRSLAAQYARYGRWKAQMVKLHPSSVRLRQVVAPAFVLSILFFGAFGFVWHPAWLVLLVIVAAYASLAAFCALKAAQRKSALRLVPLIAVAFLVIHTVWGSNFLIGLVRPPK